MSRGKREGPEGSGGSYSIVTLEVHVDAREAAAIRAAAAAARLGEAEWIRRTCVIAAAAARAGLTPEAYARKAAREVAAKAQPSGFRRAIPGGPKRDK